MLTSDVNETQRLRIRLALLPHDSIHAHHLLQGLLGVSPSEFVVIRQGLLDAKLGGDAHFQQARLALRGVMDSSTANEEQRFRAICFLGSNRSRDPDDVKLEKAHAGFAARHLIQAIQRSPNEYSSIMEMCRPLRHDLVEPLVALFRDPGHTGIERTWAATILADMASDQKDVLFDLLLNAEPAQFRILLNAIEKPDQGSAIAFFRAHVKAPPAEQATAAEKDLNARQRANAAIGLIELSAQEEDWSILQGGEDMSSRSYVIDRMARYATPPARLVKRLKTCSDAFERRALYLSLGNYAADSLGQSAVATIVNELRLRHVYRYDPDPGIHGAVGWLMRQWGFGDDVRQLDDELNGLDCENRRWYVTRTNQTMAILGPVSFRMGSPGEEEGRDVYNRPNRIEEVEAAHDVHIDRSFAIAVHEVTWRQMFPGVQSDEGDLPAEGVTWSQAAKYCNGLSQQEGIPQDQFCYVQSGTDSDLWEAAPNFLSLSGYRLPTEAEWEYACRAGTVTARFFGHSAELLPEYAWCPRSSPTGTKRPVGLKKPNDLGLFDVYGNAVEWCHDLFIPFSDSHAQADRGGPADVSELPEELRKSPLRVLRGSAAGDLKPARSALRDLAPYFETKGVAEAIGFRVARTIAAK
jgi:formylglycine-generating enzyme required for sulfatase activity